VWFQKISIPPPHRVIGNSKGEESMSLNWNFQRDGGFKPIKTLCGGSVWIFSGTTHYIK